MGMVLALSLGMIGCGNKKGTEQNSSEKNTESLSAKEETDNTQQSEEVQQENDALGNDTKVINLEHPGYASPDALVADYLEAVSRADYAKMVSVRLPYKFDLMMSLEEDYRPLHYDRFKHYLPEEYLEVLIGLEDDLDEVYYNYKEENDNTYIGSNFTWDTWKEACGEEKAPDAFTDWCQKNVPEFSPIVAGYQYKVTIDSPNYNGNGTPILEFNMAKDADGKYYLLTVMCSELG